MKTNELVPDLKVALLVECKSKPWEVRYWQQPEGRIGTVLSVRDYEGGAIVRFAYGPDLFIRSENLLEVL